MRISDWSSDVCSSDLGPRCFHPSGGRVYAWRWCASSCDVSNLLFQNARNRTIGINSNAAAASPGCRANREASPMGAAKDGVNPFTLDSGGLRSEAHTSELQSLMRISYAVFCLKKKRTHA